jgi:hypothetical protein
MHLLDHRFVFGVNDWGFLKEGVKDYVMTPMSPLDRPTFSVFTTTVIRSMIVPSRALFLHCSKSKHDNWSNNNLTLKLKGNVPRPVSNCSLVKYRQREAPFASNLFFPLRCTAVRRSHPCIYVNGKQRSS